MNILRLIPDGQGDAITVAFDRALVGRDRACEIHLQDASVSRQHAEIRNEEGDWMIEDLNSSNGILINGARVPNGRLEPGQTLTIGNVKFRVEIDRGDDGQTVVLGRSPISLTSATMLQAGPPRPAAAPRPTWFFAVVLLAVVGPLALLGGFFYWSRNQEAKKQAELQAKLREEQARRPTPTPETPTPTPPPTPAPPTPPPVRLGVLLFTSDAAVPLSIDGRTQPAMKAGEMRRIQVTAGEHIVSFASGAGKREDVVKVAAGEQSVIRYLSASQSTSISAPVAAPETSATPAATPLVATLTTPSPSPAPTATPFAVPASNTDKGLIDGVSAVEKGDFYRALLVLKDAARRLEEDPRALRDCARANAYLAWTYQALDRKDEAKAAAEKAMRMDSSVSQTMSGMPSSVAALFRRAR